MDVLDIFCDESGFTGQNLLNPDQRYFAYGSVAISPTEAAEVVTQTIRDFRLQGKELKGKNLLRRPSGRKAATALIRQLGARSQVVIVHKQYALGGKLFEYTFEPLISEISTLLYGVNFHKFIANLVYVCSIAGHERARDFVERFEKGVRGEEESLKTFLSVHSPKSADDPIEALISFCVYHRDAILRELREAKEAVPWLLDITGSSLNSLLTTWGRRADQLRVVCDESGPLATAASFFDVWIGREDKRSIRLGGRRIDLGFNLVGPVTLSKSHDSPGIQLADVLSAVAASAISDPTDEWSKEMTTELFRTGAIHADSILPERDRLDLDLPEPRLNVLILLELLSRSEEGQSLTAGLPEFIRDMSEAVKSGAPFR